MSPPLTTWHLWVTSVSSTVASLVKNVLVGWLEPGRYIVNNIRTRLNNRPYIWCTELQTFRSGAGRLCHVAAVHCTTRQSGLRFTNSIGNSKVQHVTGLLCQYHSQVIGWKDSSPKWPVMCCEDKSSTHSLTSLSLIYTNSLALVHL